MGRESFALAARYLWSGTQKQREGARLSVGRIIGRLAGACVGLALVVCPALAGSESLSEYPRRSVSELQAEARKQLGAGGDLARDGFVVVGRVMEAPGSGLPTRWLLVDQVMACCVTYEVALPLSGKVKWEDDAWVAVYGRLEGGGIRPFLSRITRAGRMIHLGKADATITVERIVPAEKVVHDNNVLDLIESEYLGGFRELVQGSGLADALRAAEDVTLLMPHDRALADDSTPSPDAEPTKQRHFVLGHAARGRFEKRDLLDRDVLVMLNGDRHAIEWINGKLHIGGTRVLMADLGGQNGVAHIITPALPVSDPSVPTESFAVGGRDATYSYDPLELPVAAHPVGDARSSMKK